MILCMVSMKCAVFPDYSRLSKSFCLKRSTEVLDYDKMPKISTLLHKFLSGEHFFFFLISLDTF